MEAELVRRIMLKWRWDWWKHIAEMEAGLIKNIVEVKADWWKFFAEMEAGFTKNIGEWKRYFL